MNERIRTLAAMLWLLFSAQLIEAQQATELYIPIGASPNLSDGNTVIGTIAEVDAEEHTISVRCESASDLHTGTLTDETQIFLDKSKLPETNDYGTFSDLVEGARVEMLYHGEEHDLEGRIRWVKVELTNDPP
jgi:hypothetical protein